MTPHCPVCNEPMKQHGRVYQCEPCRQIIIFLDVSGCTPYTASCGAPMAPNEKPGMKTGGRIHEASGDVLIGLM